MTNDTDIDDDYEREYEEIISETIGNTGINCFTSSEVSTGSNSGTGVTIKNNGRICKKESIFIFFVRFFFFFFTDKDKDKLLSDGCKLQN